MSVIIKDENDEIRMYCKGADSIMLNLLYRDFNNMQLTSITFDTKYGNVLLSLIFYLITR
jgi:magnesium-transporting ATPase (P-type)